MTTKEEELTKAATALAAAVGANTTGVKTGSNYENSNVGGSQGTGSVTGKSSIGAGGGTDRISLQIDGHQMLSEDISAQQQQLAQQHQLGTAGHSEREEVSAGRDSCII
ncbi:uncharacterized protein LOC142357522 [Convolutriloba macropyga]|uniref:uncharacterized protein LOC142357522 n=1 Tax=Convolutriloba macropyga TaxID=536237 RepID=UPI003F52855C